jgi:heme-binding protein
VAVIAVPSATAANDPCAASEIARTIGSVATGTATYLDAHPETNLALNAAAQQPGPALAAPASPPGSVAAAPVSTAGTPSAR